MIGNRYSNIINSKLNENLALRDIKTNWQQIKQVDNITMYSTVYQNYEVKLTKFEGNASVNFEKASQYFFDNLDAQKQNRESCDQLVKLETIDQDAFVIFFQTKSRLVVSSRYSLCVLHRKRLSNNEIMIARDQIDDHQNAPKTDAIKVESKFGVIFLKKINENTTHLEMYQLLDPKGSIPLSFVNSMPERQFDALLRDLQYIQKM
ncbi:START domain protein (macronuclear) [Tetrahymena thermophila SB210]|uniref:START domain protein n=1 Tax=Tetrahymena thermophila (strain SB210) TaxID=312017 RepID=I7MEE2_TETTS|nr:START domain protein [Tetrahymena thermophila SB210]EAR96164.1 START domain protein [Tetrahymena thermophila SB210]|eukprot:XP_001016409.1 START domain protein [Tetrahymena thermophila SB210]